MDRAIEQILVSGVFLTLVIVLAGLLFWVLYPLLRKFLRWASDTVRLLRKKADERKKRPEDKK